MFTLTGISQLIFLATILNVFTAYASWRRRNAFGGNFFSAAMLALTLWTLSAGLDYAAVPLDLKILFAKLEVVGYSSAIALLTAFAIVYAGNGRWLRKWWVITLLVVIPAAAILMAWTNDLHHLVWSDFLPGVPGTNTIIFVHGPLFAWMLAAGYSLILVIAANLLQVAFTGIDLLRNQAWILLVALLIPVTGNLLYLFDVFNIPGVDWTSVSFSITGLLCLLALYGTRFLEIVPIARNQLMEELPDGVLLLDTQDRLVDFNHRAAALFNLSSGDLWSPLQKSLGKWPALVAWLLLHDVEKERELPLGDQEEVFDLHMKALVDGRGRRYSWLVMLRDVSERRLMEEASVKLAAMEERQRMARNLHDSLNQSIHSLTLFSDTLRAVIRKKNLERAGEIATQLQESARQAHKETRLLLFELQSETPEAEFDLLRDLEERLEKVERHSGVNADLVFEGSLDDCPAEWRENLRGIAVEALNNVLKHAQAKNVCLTIRCKPGQVELEVQDDGKGFDLTKVRSGGMGLTTMRTRAELLGGKLAFEAVPTGGTRVKFILEEKAENP